MFRGAREYGNCQIKQGDALGLCTLGTIGGLGWPQWREVERRRGGEHMGQAGAGVPKVTGGAEVGRVLLRLQCHIGWH